MDTNYDSTVYNSHCSSYSFCSHCLLVILPSRQRLRSKLAGPPTPHLLVASSPLPHLRRQQRVYVAIITSHTGESPHTLGVIKSHTGTTGTITTRSHTGMIITGTTSHIGVSHTGSHHRGDIVVVEAPTEEAITRTRVSGDLLLLLIVGNRPTRVGDIPTRIIGVLLLLPTRIIGDLLPLPLPLK